MKQVISKILSFALLLGGITFIETVVGANLVSALEHGFCRAECDDGTLCTAGGAAVDCDCTEGTKGPANCTSSDGQHISNYVMHDLFEKITNSQLKDLKPVK